MLLPGPSVFSSQKQTAHEDDMSIHTYHSTSSRGSVRSARIKATARKAMIKTEVAALQRKQELEAQKLALEHKQRQLDVQVELDKAQAEEDVYLEYEQSSKAPSVLSDGVTKLAGPDDNTGGKMNYIETWKATVAEHMPDKIEVEAEVEVHHDPSPTVKTLEHPQTGFEQAHGMNDYYQRYLPSEKNLPSVPEHASVSAVAASSVTVNEQLLHLIHGSQKQQQKLVDAIQMPRTKLQTFDGDPMHYWMFIRNFENNCERESADNTAKLTRLVEYCTGKARKVIEHCVGLDPAVGYVRARKLLRERFGNDFIIAEACIQKITAGGTLKASDREGLMDLSDELVSCVEMMRSMNKLSELNNQRSLVMIVQRLPPYLQQRWKREAHKITKRNGKACIQDVVSFISDAAEEVNDPVFGNLMLVQPDKSQHTYAKARLDKRTIGGSRQQFTSFNVQCDESMVEQSPCKNYQKTMKCCVLCNQDHTLFGCDEFKKRSPEERLKFVLDKKLCINCLQAGHFANRCRRDTTCTVTGCGRKHTKFLHQLKGAPELFPSRGSSRDTSSSALASSDNTITSVKDENSYTGVGAYYTDALKVSLPVLPVKIYSSSGNDFVEVLALLDNGSTNSFCAEELLPLLDSHCKYEELTLTTLEKQESVVDTYVTSFMVSDPWEHNCIHLSKVYTRSTLPAETNVANPKDVANWPHLRGIDFPTIGNQKIMLIIGMDNPDALMPLEVRRGFKGAPYATKTVRGWTLNGPLGMTDKHKATSTFVQADYKLQTQVEAQCKLDACELCDDDKQSMSINDGRAMSIAEESITNTGEQCQMAIPFKKKPPIVFNNRAVAVRRLQSLGRKLRKDNVLFHRYCLGTQDKSNKGYAEKIPAHQVMTNKPARYLPYHPVLTERKSDNIRNVFDHSSKFKGMSLNDQVLKEPDLMNNPVGVSLGFREKPVTLLSDIEAMFHRVQAQPGDCEAWIYLWWPGNDMIRETKQYGIVVLDTIPPEEREKDIKTLDRKYNVSECALGMHWNVECDTRLGTRLPCRTHPSHCVSFSA